MNLVATLSRGIHVISHEKENGAIEVRCVTLDPSLIEKWDWSFEETPGILRVWSLNKREWISVYPETVHIYS